MGRISTLEEAALQQRDVQLLLDPHLRSAGWQMYGPGFKHPIDGSGYGILRCTVSNRQDGIWLLPKVGYHHVALQRLSAELRGETYDRKLPSVSENLADVMPQRPYPEWQVGIGRADQTAESIADDLARYGLPFILDVHRGGLRRIRQLIEGQAIASEWRYPPVLLALGHKDIADALVRRRLAAIADDETPFARAYKPFAKRVLDHSP